MGETQRPRLTHVQDLFLEDLADKGGSLTPFYRRHNWQDYYLFGPWEDLHELQQRTVEALEDRGLIEVLPEGVYWQASNYTVRLTDAGWAYVLDDYTFGED